MNRYVLYGLSMKSDTEISKKVVTLAKACEVLEIHIQTAYRWIGDGVSPLDEAKKIGGRWWVPMASIQQAVGGK